MTLALVEGRPDEGLEQLRASTVGATRPEAWRAMIRTHHDRSEVEEVARCTRRLIYVTWEHDERARLWSQHDALPGQREPVWQRAAPRWPDTPTATGVPPRSTGWVRAEDRGHRGSLIG